MLARTKHTPPGFRFITVLNQFGLSPGESTRTQTTYTMESKKIIGLILTLFGGGALVYGVLSITGGEVGNGQAWGATILGIVFFLSGIGLMKSVGGGAGETGGNQA